jgi:predicted nucleic acid-binding protein
MTAEVFWDTSGFFALVNSDDPAHNQVCKWLKEGSGDRPVTTEWVIGETLTLLVARRKPHLVSRFLDLTGASEALLAVNPNDLLLIDAKDYIRKHAGAGYSFTDCISFCLMKERRIRQALTTDSHFKRAGFSSPLFG